jgi:cytochrome c551/c552
MNAGAGLLASGGALRGSLRLLLNALACVIASAPLHAAGASPVARGEGVARNVCAACHVVARDQPPPLLSQVATSFSEIANRPGVSEQSLRKFILTTHWDGKTVPVTMPNPMLTAEQARAVARYILSLRNPQ